MELGSVKLTSKAKYDIVVAWMRNVPHDLMYLSIWSLTGGSAWGRLWNIKEAEPCKRLSFSLPPSPSLIPFLLPALPLHISLPLFLPFSLPSSLSPSWSLSLIPACRWNVISQPSVPDTMPCHSLYNGLHLLGTISQISFLFSKWLLITLFYHSKRETI